MCRDCRESRNHSSGLAWPCCVGLNCWPEVLARIVGPVLDHVTSAVGKKFSPTPYLGTGYPPTTTSAGTSAKDSLTPDYHGVSHMKKSPWRVASIGSVLDKPRT